MGAFKRAHGSAQCLDSDNQRIEEITRAMDEYADIRELPATDAYGLMNARYKAFALMGTYRITKRVRVMVSGLLADHGEEPSGMTYEEMEAAFTIAYPPARALQIRDEFFDAIMEDYYRATT